MVGFGILDLRYQTGFFVKLEPALGNEEIAERGLGKKLDHMRRYLTV